MNRSSRRYLTIALALTVMAILVIAAGVLARAAPGDHSTAQPPAAAVARTSIVAPMTSESVRIAAANLLASRYGRSRMYDWNVRVNAAGPRCAVLLVEVGVILDDSMAEAMHYGVGSYVVYDGGVQRYYMERGFRGVAYRDSSGKTWAFGSLSETEADTLVPCP